MGNTITISLSLREKIQKSETYFLFIRRTDVNTFFEMRIILKMEEGGERVVNVCLCQ